MTTMVERSGWIKLHRKLIDSAIFDNPKLLKVWIWCLCKASHKPFELMVGNQIVQLQEGQFVFGRQKAAVELNINDRTVYDYMKLLEKCKMVNIKANNKFSVVTIEKWAFYQGCDDDYQQQTSQQTNNKPTTDQHQTNTNKNVKNDKNVKNEKKYSDIPSLNEAVLAFVDFRKKIKKPMTDHAVDLMLKKLDKMTDSTDGKIAILNQSILNGWQGIFPLKDGGTYGQNNGNSSEAGKYGTYI